jgi:hypothetical protein
LTITSAGSISQPSLSRGKPPLLLFFRKLGKPPHANFGDFFGYFLNCPFSFASHAFPARAAKFYVQYITHGLGAGGAAIAGIA